MSDSKDCFFCWLTDPGKNAYPELAAHAEAANWPTVHSLAQAWNLIDAAALTDPEKATLRRAASLAFVDFERDRAPRPGFMGLTGFGIGVFLFMATTLGMLIFVMVEPALNGFFGELLQQKTLLDRLKDPNAARGLITFVFSIGVIAIALIIVTANVTGASRDGKRLEISKEILTSLIAILGTIIGFYFGTSSGGN